MKKLILILSIFGCWVSTQAQNEIDRSKQPEPGPVPTINLKEADRYDLNNGIKLLIVEDHKLPRVSIQLAIDNPPYAEGDKVGVGSLLSSLLGKGSKNISKDEFNEEIDFLGARLNFGSEGGFASTLSKYFPRILELMAEAALQPNFTQEEFDKEKNIILADLESREKDVSAIASLVQGALAYGKDHPYGEFITEESINKITLEDVKRAYAQNFNPSNAYIVVIGDVNTKEVVKMVKKNFKSWKASSVSAMPFEIPSDVAQTEINFVDMPNAVQSEVMVQNIIDLKMKDADYLPALLTNQILGGGAEGRLFLNLREDKGYTYGSYSNIANDKYSPVRFRAFAQVRNAVTDSSVVQILTEMKNITTDLVTDEELASAKAKYKGRFIRSLESPNTIAGFAINTISEDLSEDFYQNYLKTIDEISKEDVLATAKKYFKTDQARVVVVGKGSEVLENLEKIDFQGRTLQVNYFDIEANPTAKPEYKMELPADLTAKKVLNAYIEAIGGIDAVSAVNAYEVQAVAEIQGMQLELKLDKAGERQFTQELNMMGSTMQKAVIDGNSGYQLNQGQRKDLSAEEVEEALEESAFVKELLWLNRDEISLIGIENVNGVDAYALQVSEKRKAFYAVETGLKLQETVSIEMQGQSFEQNTMYDDYRPVSGVLYPYKLTQSLGPQLLDFIVEKAVIK